MYSRRDSAGSQTSSSRHRPKLLRSSATAPSITPSSSIQASLVSPHSPQRAAADLLSKVAVYVPHTSASSVPPSNPIMIDGARGSTSSSASGDMSSSLSDNYFSFPSFDDWECSKQDDSEKESYT